MLFCSVHLWLNGIDIVYVISLLGTVNIPGPTSCLGYLCLYTFVSKNVVYVSEISTVNLIIGWKLFAFRRKYTLSLVVFHIDMTSSMGLTSLAATWMNLCFWGSMYGFILSSFDRSGTTGFKCQLRSSYTLTIHITCMKMQLTIWMDFVENPRLHLKKRRAS